MKQYYQMGSDETRMQINGSLESLSSEQVQWNIRRSTDQMSFRKRRRKSIRMIFLEQYKDFLIYHSDYLGNHLRFSRGCRKRGSILIVITINAILGTVQTVKAEKSLNSLKKLSGPEAKVERDGTVMQIPSREVTVGDIVILEAGDQVPADGRIIEQASLKVDESALTGESIPVEKSIDLIEGEVPLGDRVNMVFSGKLRHTGEENLLLLRYWYGDGSWKDCILLKTTRLKRTFAPGQFGSVWSETFYPYSDSLCNPHGNQRVERRILRRCIYVAVCACGCGNSGGIEFYCNNRTFFWYAEDGKRTCDHQKTPGCRRSGQCVCYLFSDKTGER